MKDDDDIPDPFSIRKLPHKSAFYSTILSRQYQVTRHISDLRKAFHNAGGVEQFVSAMMNAMTSGENWDDYRATIALLARQIEASMEVEEFKGVVHLITDYNNKYAMTQDEEGNPILDEEKAVTSENAFQSRNFLKYFSNQLKKYSK